MSLTIDNSNCAQNNTAYHLRNLYIPSRYFLAPINTGFAVNGNPTKDLLRFHSDRSGKGIGISYVGNVAINREHVPNSSTAFFTYELESWQSLVHLIQNNGSVPGIQLACRSSKLIPLKKWSNRNIENYIRAVRNEIDELSVTDLEKIVSYFVKSAEIAAGVGFQVIQIHAAHGYLISKFMNRILNIREDSFGKNKTLLLEMVISAIRARLPDIVLDVRVSILDGLEAKEVELSYKLDLIERVTDLDVDIVSLTNGIYDVNKQLIYPPISWGHGVNIEMALPFARKQQKILWNVAGNIWDLQLLPVSPCNLSFSIGRSLIADHEFVQKSLSEQRNAVNACERCGLCHYYSRGMQHIICPVNEHLKQLTPSTKPQ